MFRNSPSMYWTCVMSISCTSTSPWYVEVSSAMISCASRTLRTRIPPRNIDIKTSMIVDIRSPRQKK